MEYMPGPNAIYFQIFEKSEKLLLELDCNMIF